MIITCPACKAQADIPASKEGAKVRCGECSRVYRAVSGGRQARSSSQSDPTKYFIIGGAVLLLGAIFFMTRGKGVEKAPPKTAEKTPAVAEPEKAPMDWNAPQVQAVVKLHTFAQERNAPLLRANLSGAGLISQMPEGEAPDKAFNLLSTNAQVAILDDGVKDILEGELIADWEPFDGWVVPIEKWDTNLPQNSHVVRVAVAHRDKTAGHANRHVEWHLEQNGPTYKAFGWKRWISEAEAAANQAKKVGKIQQKTLSDGSVVVEGHVRPIDYMEETTAEEQAQIESLIDQLIDPESNKIFGVRKELEAIGKPAIPGLLSRLATIPLETQEEATQLNLIHKTLGDITGYRTTFKVSELVGATRERQESGLKQWFGWYDRRFKRFTQKPEEEPE